ARTVSLPWLTARINSVRSLRLRIAAASWSEDDSATWGSHSAYVDVHFARPPQRQVPIVQALGLALNPVGFVQVDELHRETSRPGIYAGGDLVTPMQGAIIAAASGTQAAGMLNHALVPELAAGGLLG
nr:hypothetical protein [Myxococcota bacterium]